MSNKPPSNAQPAGEPGPPEPDAAASPPHIYAAKVALVLAAWVGGGAFLVISNKILLTNGLRSPISLTVLHMCASLAFANLMVSVGGFERQACSSRAQRLKVAALAAAFGVSVVSGIASYRFIPVSFAEMISSTTPMFTAAFAFLVAGERPATFVGYLSLLCIAIGASIASHGEPMWHTLGFALAVLSTVLRALKAVLQQVLLQDEEEKLDSINLLRHMTLFVIVLLAPLAAVMEGPTRLVEEIARAHQLNPYSQLGWCLFFNVSTAFLVNWIQMQVTKMIGATVLQVLGILKGTIPAILSILIFRNPVTLKTAFGYALVVVSVVSYQVSRNQEWARSVLERLVRHSPFKLSAASSRAWQGIPDDAPGSPQPSQRASAADSPERNRAVALTPRRVLSPGNANENADDNA